MTTLALTAVMDAGCADDAPPPTTLPAVTPSASAGPAEVAAPEVPVEAMAETAQGASAFLRFYFEQVNLAYALGSTSVVMGLFTVDGVVAV